MDPFSQTLESLRPAVARPSPWSTPKVLHSMEPDGLGGEVETTTVFLTGAECPFRCTMCDLWQYTSDENTPVGAIPFQLGQVLNAGSAARQWLKLYNASNFFDNRSVPKQDLQSILNYCSPFERIIVENHPRLCDDRMKWFANSLTGKLEVAMGLETIHPRAMKAMNKGMTLDDFDNAIDQCYQMGIDVRVFALLHPPGVPWEESVEWTCRTISYALERNVRHVSVIPVRAGNGWVDQLIAKGLYRLPNIELVRRFALAYQSQEWNRPQGSVLEFDMWNWEQITGGCESCREILKSHLLLFNRTQTLKPLDEAASECECNV